MLKKGKHDASFCGALGTTIFLARQKRLVAGSIPGRERFFYSTSSFSENLKKITEGPIKEEDQYPQSKSDYKKY